MTIATDYVRRHLRFGWFSLLIFATLGFLLEALHGFKVRGYVDAASETRRLMWTLAHAHGTLLAILHIVFALTLRGIPEFQPERLALTSRLLFLASLILPIGFFLGGVQFYAGDPGLGVLLVPVGAACLLTAVFLCARGAWTPARPAEKGQKTTGKGPGT